MRWVLIALAGAFCCALAFANEGTASPMPTGTALDAVTLTPATIPADGATQTTAAVAFTGQGTSDNVTFSTTSGQCQAGPITANFNLLNQDYEAQITATTAAGNCTITANDITTGATATGTLQQTGTSVGAPTFTANPIPADGSTTTTAKVVVDDGSGNPVSTDTVQFNLGAPCSPSTVAAAFDNTNQDYEATLTASQTAGNCSITATDTTASLTGSSATLQQTGTGVGTPTFTTNPIPADGSTTTTAKVVVTDAAGNHVSTDTVQFNLGAPCSPSTVAAAFNNSNQDYEATLTASQTAGNCSITATDTTASLTGAAATLQQTGTAVGTPTLTPNAIPADGASQATAKVVVTDGAGNHVSTDTVHFNLGGPCSPSTVAASFNNTNQDYEATITASHTSGACSITATDTTANLTGASATLTQTSASVAAPTFTSNSITANGSSQTTAKVAVDFLNGSPDTTATVQFNVGAPCSPATVPATYVSANQDYEATITATTTAGSCTVTATATNISLTGGSATLTQVAGPPAHLNLGSFSPNTIVANGASTATATATVSDAFNNPISGQPPLVGTSDPGVGVSVAPAGSGAYTVTVTSSTTAHPVTITAIEAGMLVSQVITQVHGPARNVAVSLSSPVVTADGISSVLATIRVTDAGGNPISGERIRLSSSQPGIRFGAVTAGANGVYTASVTASNHPATLFIIATDTSASPNISGETALKQTRAPSLLSVATMQWTFAFHPSYTIVAALQLSGAPGGASLRIICHGGGCPFAKRTMSVVKLPICKRHQKRHCRPAGPIRLGLLFGSRHLHVGTKVTVEVLRTGWIGKYYSFKMRRGRAPLININCLAPGGTVPGFGCS